jgi:integrase
MALTDTTCKNVKPANKSRKLSDAGGLYLEVMPSGSKYWRLKYRYGGKEKRVAFGVYPEVSLKDAREKRDKARKLIAEGMDPSYEKKQEKLKRHINQANSFEIIAREWHEHRKLGWTIRHADYVLKRLEADIFPALGFKPIHEISAPELLVALRAVENRGAIDIAHRLLQTTGQIFRYAIATGRSQHDIAADLRGALKSIKRENFARLEAKELPEFLMKLDGYDGDLQTKLALKLLILTFTRSGEIRGASWEEFDFEKREWRIPAERMKMKEPHIVPLSDEALEVLEKLRLINGQRSYLFPNRNKPHTFISENTLLYAVYRMGYHNQTTVHGFRALASTILNEHGFRPDVIERQLAHAERNKVRAAYNHAQYLPERREMMQWWGDYISGLASENKIIFGNFKISA